MLGRILDFVLGFFARLLFPHDRQAHAFDMEAIFERLQGAGENFLEKFQRLLLAVFGALALGALASAVLTVRIFQLSAGSQISIFGLFNVDGAVLFGILLAAGATLVAYGLLRNRRTPAERPAPRESAYRQPPASPLEDALAAWILRRLEEQDRRAQERGDGASESSSEDAWSHPMSARRSEPPPDRHPHA